MRSRVGILLILILGLVLSVAVFRNRAQPSVDKEPDSTSQTQSGGASMARPSPPTTPAQSRITNVLNVTGLTDRADLIIVGQVTGVNDQSVTSKASVNGATPTDGLLASLQVKRVIKGSIEAPDGQQGLLSVEMPHQGKRGLSAGTTGVFFLRQIPSHAYTVVDPDNPFVLAKEPSPANAGDALDRVVAEVDGVLQSKDASIYDRKDAIFALRWVKTDAATAALRRAARDENAEVRLLAMITLLGNGDISVLDKFADVLLNAPSGIPSPYTAGNLSGALRQLDDPKAVPALARLLHARDAGVRSNAAMGLRHIGTEAVIAPLSEALDDRDQMVRYQAVMGLATATGEMNGAPSLELFKSDEKRYIDYWRGRVRNQ
jgi:HEAT repeats